MSAPQAEAEIRRREYLSALGIQGYLPRTELPGAAPSTYLLEEAAPPEPPEPAPAAGGGELLRSALDNLEEKQRGRTPAEPTRPAPPSTPRFQLSVWRLRPGLMVLDSHQPRAALPVNALLDRIRLALAIGRAPAAPQRLTWPLGDAPARRDADQRGEARDMVQAYLAVQDQQDPLDTLLLMGDAAVRYTLSLEHSPLPESASLSRSLLGQSLELPARGVLPEPAGERRIRAIVLPSLADVLQDPTLKPLVWRAIRHLRGQ